MRRHSDISGASPADFAAEELRALAGFCLTAAEALDVASGYGPEVDLAVGRDDRRLVQIPGFEDVEILVSNSFGDDEVAVQKARECLATLTAGRPVRRPAEKPVEPAGLVRLSKVGRHEFDIAGVTDVRLVVLNQACPVAAEQEAHEALRSIGVRI
ncbi:hypothetical protein [Planctomyces sp. SH-PL14]|uniref:hypothetical protein n=1 Tax=Planctomyces sp. SH-PL14 TaxID=1632864 RepID=UPI0012E8D9C3|nr:hypothetical protein [Planctomyces sp. SH-PL14]